MFHSKLPTACYGVCVEYYEPFDKKKIYVYVKVFTDVLDKMHVAVKELEKFVLESLLERHWFKAVWKAAGKVAKFYDSGRGFFCETVLAYKLLELSKECKKDMISLMRIGGHGNPARVDGVCFGMPGLGKAMLDTLKIERLLTT